MRLRLSLLASIGLLLPLTPAYSDPPPSTDTVVATVSEHLQSLLRRTRTPANTLLRLEPRGVEISPSRNPVVHIANALDFIPSGGWTYSAVTKQITIQVAESEPHEDASIYTYDCNIKFFRHLADYCQTCFKTPDCTEYEIFNCEIEKDGEPYDDETFPLPVSNLDFAAPTSRSNSR